MIHQPNSVLFCLSSHAPSASAPAPCIIKQQPKKEKRKKEKKREKRKNICHNEIKIRDSDMLKEPSRRQGTHLERTVETVAHNPSPVRPGIIITGVTVRCAATNTQLTMQVLCQQSTGLQQQSGVGSPGLPAARGHFRPVALDNSTGDGIGVRPERNVDTVHAQESTTIVLQTVVTSGAVIAGGQTLVYQSLEQPAPETAQGKSQPLTSVQAAPYWQI